MPHFSSLLRTLPVLLLSIWVCSSANAQIYHYTDATGGAPNTVAANATGTNLYLVNSTTTGTGCTSGYLTKSYIAGSTQFVPSSTKGIGWDVEPATGYQLQITGFEMQARRASGSARRLAFAYSLDGGTNWTIYNGPSGNTWDLGTAAPACDAMTTYTWTLPTPVVTTSSVKVYILGLGATSLTGILQLKEIKVLGNVVSGTPPACAAPGPATNLVVNAMSQTQTNINYTAPVPAADSYLVVASSTATLSAGPVNGTSYPVGSALGGGSVVYRGTGTGTPIFGLNPTQDYYYHVYAYTNNSGCSGGAAYAPAVIGADTMPVPVVTAQPVNDTACSNTTASFSVTATNAMGYQWQVFDGTTWTNLTNSSVYANTTAAVLGINNAAGLNNNEYRCIVFGSAATNDTSAAATLVETIAGNILAQPGAQVVCNGNTASFVIDAAGTGITYQWQVNTGSGFANIAAGAPYTGVQTDSLAIASAMTLDGYYYRCVVSGPCGTVTSDSAMLTVNPFPVVAITHTTPLSFCPGDSVILSSPTGTGLSYQWFFNSNLISGATTAQYTARSTGSYRVRIISTAGCSGMDSVAVTVVPLPAPVVTRAGLNLSTTAFSSYQWYRDGVLIPGATAQTYTAAQNGSYTVEVTNSAGCKGMSTATTIGGVGVEEIGLDAQVKIYPNPVSSVLIIETPLNMNAVLRDMTGKVVLQAQRVRRLDLRALAGGVYILTLSEPASGRSLTKQVVKMHE